MNEKQVNQWLRRRFGTVGWVLTGYYILMNLLVFAVAVFDSVRLGILAASSGRWETDTGAIAGSGWGYLLTIAVGIVILNAWKGREYWKREILVKEKPMKPVVLLLALSLTVAAQLVNSLWVGVLEGIANVFGKTFLPALELVSGSSDTFSMFLYASILGPIAEEILFRGFVLGTLRPYGKKFAIFCSALLFGIFHGNLLQSPYAFLMGLVMGWVAVEYSFGWAVGVHIFNNLVLADLFTRLLDLLPVIAANLLQLTVYGVFTAAAVVLLIVYCRRIGAYIRSGRMDGKCVKCFFTSPGVLVFMGMMLVSMISTMVMLFSNTLS